MGDEQRCGEEPDDRQRDAVHMRERRRDRPDIGDVTPNREADYDSGQHRAPLP
jgi:hypothetical protein